MDMEGVEFQIRSSQSYPLSLDQRILQGEHHRNDRLAFQNNLKSIETFYNSPEAPPHSGQPDCQRCLGKKRQIREAYRQWYLSDSPDRWYSNLFDYKAELSRMFDSPEVTLDQIHHRAEVELRNHFKRDLATPNSRETPQSRYVKSFTGQAFDAGLSTPEILHNHLNNQMQSLRDFNNPGGSVAGNAAAELLQKLQSANSEADRIPIFIDYYCRPNPEDSHQLRQIKSKYAQEFRRGLSHDYIVSEMKKEVVQSQQKDMHSLVTRLGELQMGRSAHLKNQAKKAEKTQKKDRIIEDRSSSTRVKCELEECESDVDLKIPGGPIQCALCDWLAAKTTREHHAFYCSVEHATIDIDKHDLKYHQCEMGGHCINYPEPGPPEDTTSSGICPVCVGYERRASYFCSQECFSRNLEAHRRQVHDSIAMSNFPNTLEFFQPRADLKVEPL